MEYYHKCANKRVRSKPLCILFSDTKRIQWADTDATLVYALTTEAYHYKNSLTTSLFYNVQDNS